MSICKQCGMDCRGKHVSGYSVNSGSSNGQFKHGKYVGMNNSKRLRKLFKMPSKCQIKGCANTPQVWHHRNGNPKDNRKENLVALCRSCHSKLHRLSEYRDHGRVDNPNRDKLGKYARR